MSSTVASPILINEEKVKFVLSWQLVNRAVEEALKAVVSKSGNGDSLPFSHQPARSFTFTENKNGVLLTMPGFVGNYTLNGKPCNTLACKLVTSFGNNENQKPPLPNIIANILLFDNKTGQLKCVIEGTEITAWRTAAASIVSTNYLYFRSERCVTKPILAVIGCGVQGRIHAIGFASSFDVSEIRLWNRTPLKAESVAKELEQMRSGFINKSIKITVMPNIESCLLVADIIVTATFTSKPLIHFHMLKSDVHINAVGAGVNHHSEISENTYEMAQVFIDNWDSARVELKDLKANINCEVGEIINGTKPVPNQGITIFQSMEKIKIILGFVTLRLFDLLFQRSGEGGRAMRSLAIR